MRLILALATILSLVFTQVFAQDFNKGLDAYNAGDYATAINEWKPLAEQGDNVAQLGVGILYDKGGNGVLQDSAKAVKWWRLSAEQGNVNAQANLGIMYSTGRGALKDYSEAIKWLRAAAEQGAAQSQYNLGVIYKYGKGVLQDNVASHMWYNIASANGHQQAGEYRDEDAAKMTPEDISKATAMARECMKSNYKNCGY